LNFLRDRRYDTGRKKRASILPLIDRALERIFNPHALNWDRHDAIADLRPGNLETPPSALIPVEFPLLLDVSGFPSEGEESAAQSIVRAYQNGWRWIIAYNWRGGRFAGCGIGPDSQGLRLDLYGDIGDYAASGLDGAQVTLHGDGQDQLGQILKSGRLVIHGDAGQTFLYGAKGGEIFVLGSVAGRPLINAVGRPRSVINGTCLDYLAESFMAGDPLNGGGFVILNGVTFNLAGELIELETPYPGGNLFSLASGGCIYLRDPYHKVMDEQLNGGAFAPLSDADWQLIEPYLHENERLFGVRVEDLLRVNGKSHLPAEVYRKVAVKVSAVLREAQADPND
jgi:glutamate synthase domain-containing protein 3